MCGWKGEREKGTKGISHKLAYDLSPAIRHKKEKEDGISSRERETLCVGAITDTKCPCPSAGTKKKERGPACV